jgi:hypothetical protein
MRMINEEGGRKLTWPIGRYFPALIGGTEENTKSPE